MLKNNHCKKINNKNQNLNPKNPTEYTKNQMGHLHIVWLKYENNKNQTNSVA
jgi:agmatine/peptidylarginine deiminase